MSIKFFEEFSGIVLVIVEHSLALSVLHASPEEEPNGESLVGW